MMEKFMYSLFILLFLGANAQEKGNDILSFKEYLGYVKKYHPIAKQAELQIDMGQANLMRSRGGFDPKIEVDYDRKEFKGTEYYDKLNATFKIPTWYGLELKGNFEQNAGSNLNPSEIVPDDGLYSAGLSMSVGQGFWINERMATLKRAKLLREQTKADRDLLVNQVLFEASLAYFQWLQAYQDSQILNNFFSSAQLRFEGVLKTALAGDIAPIDTVEAKITVQNRALHLEQAKIRFVKSSLELSNFLWMGDNLPIELRPNIIPDVNLGEEIDATLEIHGKPLSSINLENHPKLISLDYKIDQLNVEKRLKANKLLPKIDLEYNLLTTKPDNLHAFIPQDYKGGLSINLPLFLRKERGDLKLAKIKLEDAKFEVDNAQIQIKNKITAIFRELESYAKQNLLINDIVDNYNILLTAEERKFSFGESSLFLVNSRESKLIDAKLKKNALQKKYYTAKAKLFNSLAVNPKKL
ncbi:TolC family protein [Arenibacter aquaticus]|nr:TolC family protein [Arenibacter aquaticus]